VEIAAKATPPVAKIIDFKKFRYLEVKRAKETKKAAKEVEVKEIHLRPFIGQHDFEVRTAQAEQFLRNGNRLKVVVKFQGREFSKKEFGNKILTQLKEKLRQTAEPQGEARWEGRNLVLFFSPIKK